MGLYGNMPDCDDLDSGKCMWIDVRGYLGYHYPINGGLNQKEPQNYGLQDKGAECTCPDGSTYLAAGMEGYDCGGVMCIGGKLTSECLTRTDLGSEKSVIVCASEEMNLGTLINLSYLVNRNGKFLKIKLHNLGHIKYGKFIYDNSIDDDKGKVLKAVIYKVSDKPYDLGEDFDIYTLGNTKKDVMTKDIVPNLTMEFVNVTARLEIVGLFDMSSKDEIAIYLTQQMFIAVLTKPDSTSNTDHHFLFGKRQYTGIVGLYVGE